MKFPRIFALVALAQTLIGIPELRAQATGPEFTRTEDVIYGRKMGVALTLDVLQPVKNSNGHAVFWMVSGGWISSHAGVSYQTYGPLLEHGYTVIAVVHGSQPKFTIPEITADIHRAIRFVRYNAKKWNIDPDHFGISVASAGGHLSLTMGTQGGPGKPDAKDVIDRESSAVQAVACFFPPTDFLNYGAPGQDAVGVGTLGMLKAAFGPRSETAEGRQELGHEISPIYFITPKMPPTLIIHGNADKLVPIQQSESFLKRAQEAGVSTQLVVKPGAEHGWPTIVEDVRTCADWFDTHLLQKPAK